MGWRASILLMVLLLAGCSGDTPFFDRSFIASSYVASTYSTSLLMRATTARAVPVRIVGQPFPDLSPGQFANRVLDAMPAGFLNRSEYMLDPGGIAGFGFRVVWNFDPDPRGSVEDICQGRSLGRRIAGEQRLRAAIALCQGPDAFVANYGTVQVSGPDDPRFASFISQMTLATLLAPDPGKGSRSGGLDMHL
jgi:hypothetical protein